MFSGCTRSSAGAQIDARLLHRYNPNTNTWMTLKAAPVTHFRPAVGAISGKLYVVGGNNGAGTAMRRATCTIRRPIPGPPGLACGLPV